MEHAVISGFLIILATVVGNVVAYYLHADSMPYIIHVLLVTMIFRQGEILKRLPPKK